MGHVSNRQMSTLLDPITNRLRPVQPFGAVPGEELNLPQQWMRTDRVLKLLKEAAAFWESKSQGDEDLRPLGTWASGRREFRNAQRQR